MKQWRLLPIIILFLALGLYLQAQSAASAQGNDLRPTVVYAEKHDLSPPLREMTPIPPQPGDLEEVPLLRRKTAGGDAAGPLRTGDAALQKVYGPNAMPTPIVNFEGTNNLEGVLPPDTNGDVGPNHYVQTVNIHFVVFDKSGNLLYGPAAINTIWQGFGGACEQNNDGDPVVLYDPIADRWLISQFAIPGPYYECIAISQTPDPTGAWYRYAFKTSDNKLNDYPKLGVWPDGYYMTANLFLNGSSWAGTGVYAFERDKMLQGQQAQMQFFELPSTDWGGMLPADLDGSNLPPAGAPNYMVEVIDGSWDPQNWPNDEIHYHEFHVDWNDPNNTTFNTNPIIINIADFDSMPCVNNNSRDCIPQQGTTEKLDAIGDRGMYRLAYRNFGDHEALVFNHTVDAGGGRAGVRWYELRRSNTADPWTVYQQSTFAPNDGLHRWMGSVAMDAVGNLAVGYSVSSSSIFPGIRYAGRLFDDPLNELTQGEGTIIDGGGAQTHSASRWGDYSMLAVDPVDDCTFWFTTEYYKTTSSSNWTTRIASFKFPNCTTQADFTLSATPDSQAVCSGSDAQYTVDVGSTGGFSDPVTLSATGNPPGTTVTFNPNPVTPPGASTMTVSNTGAASPGASTITIEGASGTLTHTTTVDLTIYAGSPGSTTLVSPADGATDVPTTPTFTWNAATDADTYRLEVATDASFNNIVHTATGIAGTSYTMPTPLEMDATYYWRVAAENPCGLGAYSTAFSFTTESKICIAPNLAIPDNDAAGVSSTLTVNNTKNIADLNVYLNIPHTLVGDLTVTLTHVDSGTTVTLLDRPGATNPGFLDRGCVGDNVDATIDDEGTDGNAEDMCNNNPAISGNVVGGDPPNTSLLTAFDGEGFGGDWTLTVTDEGWTETGSLSQWCLQPTLNCAGQTNEVTGLTISAAGQDAQLDWQDTNATSYKVYRAADDPYFTPDDATNLLATVTANTYTDAGALGDAAANYYYKVLGVDNCPPPAGSVTRVAEFDFTLVPGTN